MSAAVRAAALRRSIACQLEALDAGQLAKVDALVMRLRASDARVIAGLRELRAARVEQRGKTITLE